MDRREVLKLSIGTLGISSLSGCTSSETSQNGSAQNQQTTTSTPSRPEPEVTFQEKWEGGEKYTLSVKVQLDGADKVILKKMSGSKFATVTSDGTHKVAGSGTDVGPLKLGDSVQAVVPWQSTELTVGMHPVGSQDQMSIPIHLAGLNGSTGPSTEDQGTFSRTFEQEVHGKKTILSTEIPKIYYNYYKRRLRTNDYGGYVSDVYDDQYIKSITDDIEEFGERNNYSDREIVDHVIAVVQNMEYTQDKAATGYNEYPKYPVETLVDRGGDCEDTCILLASMLRELGYGTVLLVLRDAQHMAVGVAGDDSLQGEYYEHKGQRYFYLETTSGGWQVGQVPPEIKEAGTNAEIVEVTSRPVLAYSWAVNVPSTGGVKVKTKVRNVGDAPAKTAEI
ncbi:hypothetical protein [Haloferax sp. YSMS24]|uniref:hypothetical protein n=1 Tax=Haloferax sp. YSMS24 TaxID=3388425 RepID=UPI00398D0B0F